MFDDDKKEPGSSKKHNLLIEFVNTLEWLVTAFMLAFVFRAFVMEAFRIPTGSMADTLKGAHFRLQCPECGFGFEHGFVPESYNMRPETVPGYPVTILPYTSVDMQIRCPSCGYYMPPSEKRDVYNGDRILVLKCIYQVFEPQRWDVVVFKNPLEPKISYIKRLVGKPGETLELIDGDVYIDGKIMRKPPKVQDELWSVIYDNDYQPIKPEVGRFNNKQWSQPFENTHGSNWQVDAQHPTVFTLDSDAETVSSMRYNTVHGNNLVAGYSYNTLMFMRGAEYCSDLKVRFYVTGSETGSVGASLSKYGTIYKGYVDKAGDLVISKKAANGSEQELQRVRGGKAAAGKAAYFAFTNVDHKLILEFGEQRAELDMGRDPNSMGPIPASPDESEVYVFGTGKMSLSHVALYRDEHYLSSGMRGGGARAGRGRPFKLNADEFFMCGDNSPNSQDSRWWPSDGIGNDGITYRAGIVPRDYIVGKAVFVYWPSGWPIMSNFPLLVAPDFGDMRFIYGGSDRQM
jgi:signal peptidase I